MGSWMLALRGAHSKQNPRSKSISRASGDGVPGGRAGGLLPPVRATMRAVALRGPVTVAITFGPTTAPTLARVLELARADADELTAVSPGVWRATFTLDRRQERFAAAVRLIAMTWG